MDVRVLVGGHAGLREEIIARVFIEDFGISCGISIRYAI